MKTPINLEQTVFVPKVILSLNREILWGFNSQRKEATGLDLGNVIIGWDKVKTHPLEEKITDFVFRGLFGDEHQNDPLFAAPASWKFPQLLKALGAFPSTSQAFKNGWNKDIPEGFSSIAFRINRQKCIIAIHKINDQILSEEFWK